MGGIDGRMGRTGRMVEHAESLRPLTILPALSILSFVPKFRVRGASDDAPLLSNAHDRGSDRQRSVSDRLTSVCERPRSVPDRAF